MSLIADDPWQRVEYIYKDRNAVSPSGNDVALTEHNWYCNKVPDDADVDPSGRTTFSVSTELYMYPGRGGYLGQDNKYRNKDAFIEADWNDGDLTYDELQYEPFGDNTTEYDTSLAFTVTPAGAQAGVGIDVDSPDIRHNDYSDNPDTNVRHNWDFPAIARECGNARCSQVIIGNSGRVDAEEPSSGNINICPTYTESTYINPSLNEALTAAFFDPELL